MCVLEATLPPIFGDIDQLLISQILINQIMSQTDCRHAENNPIGSNRDMDHRTQKEEITTTNQKES
jgi:hypothetical protein